MGNLSSRDLQWKLGRISYEYPMLRFAATRAVSFSHREKASSAAFLTREGAVSSSEYPLDQLRNMEIWEFNARELLQHSFDSFLFHLFHFLLFFILKELDVVILGSESWQGQSGKKGQNENIFGFDVRLHEQRIYG